MILYKNVDIKDLKSIYKKVFYPQLLPVVVISGRTGKGATTL